jgi:hypothetical protein
VEDNPNPEGIAVTQDEIIEMAKQAGLMADGEMWFSPTYGSGDVHIAHLETFAKLVALRYQKKIADLENIICQRHWDVLQEREACAKLLERTDLGGLKSDVWLQNYTATILDGYAKAIRARGQA